jgi:hypothetical protein
LNRTIVVVVVVVVWVVNNQRTPTAVWLGSFLMRNPKDNTREQKLQKEMQEHSSATKVKSKDDQVKEN